METWFSVCRGTRLSWSGCEMLHCVFVYGGCDWNSSSHEWASCVWKPSVSRGRFSLREAPTLFLCRFSLVDRMKKWGLALVKLPCGSELLLFIILLQLAIALFFSFSWMIYVSVLCASLNYLSLLVLAGKDPVKIQGTGLISPSSQSSSLSASG